MRRTPTFCALWRYWRCQELTIRRHNDYLTGTEMVALTEHESTSQSLQKSGKPEQSIFP